MRPKASLVLFLGSIGAICGMLFAMATFTTAVSGFATDDVQTAVPTCISSWAAPTQVGPQVDVSQLSAEQNRNASLIKSIGVQRSFEYSDLIVAEITAYQESRLINLPFGDRDSLGLFQQRPSAGWGSPSQILDPSYATNKFYDALAVVDNRTKLPPTVVAQKVQRSAFPDAYAKWVPLAKQIVGPETVAVGSIQVAISRPEDSCDASTPTSPSEACVGTDAGTAKTVQGQTIRLCNAQGITVVALFSSQTDAMITAAAKDGVTLSGGGFRSYERQVQLRISNHCGNTYTAPSGSCSPPTARPGTSMHEVGLAIDFNLTNGRFGRVFTWLVNNAAKFGFCNLPTEPWHWSKNCR